MKTKSQIFSELKKAIRHNWVCDNAYYFVVFNGNEEEDYMVIDERFINEKGAEMVKELKERRKEMTKVTFFGGSGEDELLWEKGKSEPEKIKVEFLDKNGNLTNITPENKVNEFPTVEEILKDLSDEQKQLLKDTIKKGFWGDTEENFLDEDGKVVEDYSYGYCTNDAKKAGHFSGKKISGMFNAIYNKLCPNNGIGQYITQRHDWWGDGSGDMLFIRSSYYQLFEKWAKK